MPMLKTCTFNGCTTRTLTTFCLEHEVLARVRANAERAEAASASDEPLSSEVAEAAGAAG